MTIHKQRYADYSETALIQEALQVQNACNLSGILHSFVAVVQRLKELKPDYSTDAISQHRACKLFADKIISLTGHTELSDWQGIENQI